jgi:hypothetical protein
MLDGVLVHILQVCLQLREDTGLLFWFRADLLPELLQPLEGLLRQLLEDCGIHTGDGWRFAKETQGEPRLAGCGVWCIVCSTTTTKKLRVECRSFPLARCSLIRALVCSLTTKCHFRGGGRRRRRSVGGQVVGGRAALLTLPRNGRFFVRSRNNEHYPMTKRTENQQQIWF